MVARFPDSVLEGITGSLSRTVAPCVSCAHYGGVVVPEIDSRSQRRTVLSNLPIWKTVPNYVRSNGAMPSVRIFRHGLQFMYSKTKCGVDGAAQFRAGLRSSTSRFDWESKIVSQTLKTLILNSFIPWRVLRMDDVGGGDWSEFHSLDEYRRNVNVVEPFSDFIYKTSKSLLTIETTLERYATGLKL